jgi:hypothetical protein
MRRFFFAFAAFVSWMLPVACYAGTTGELTGTVTDGASQRPVAGAEVVASSPSQNERTVSDAAGRFAFVSLFPDTYTVVVNRAGYVATAYPGIVVHADAAATLTISLQRRLRIVTVILDHHYVGTNYPRPGVTADVYRVPSALPFYTVEGGLSFLLRSIPGVAAGPGLELAH